MNGKITIEPKPVLTFAPYIWKATGNLGTYEIEHTPGGGYAVRVNGKEIGGAVVFDAAARVASEHNDGTSQARAEQFFAWLDKTTKDATASPVGQQLTPLGYTVTHTGGGCLAWDRTLPDGRYVYICDEDNGLGDKTSETYLTGLYDSDGEVIRQGCVEDLARAIAWVDDNTKGIDQLVDEYTAWNKAQGLDLGSADEHRFDEKLTEDQRAWINDFCERWEVAEKYDAMQDAIDRRAADEKRSDEREGH